MSNREKSCPYRALGRILEDWRFPRFRSALGLCREAKLSFSYYAYADYERGALLPSVEHVLELAKFHKTDERPAILCWAELQMPTPRLKALFSLVGHGFGSRQGARDETGPSPSSPSFENTWVFGPQERDTIRKLPWFFELCQRLAFVFPGGLSHADLGMKKQAELDALVREHLEPWIAQGRMLFREKRIFLASPHIHLPKTGPWQEIRRINLDRAMERLSETIHVGTMESQQAYREIVTRTMSQEQIQSWVKRLQGLEEEFKAMPYTESGSTRVYSLITFFGERLFRLKAIEK